MNRSLATRHSPAAARAGFTLIEMLTVIVIISILAGMLVVTVNVARKRVRIAMIHAEVMQLDMAARALQTDYGDYPPDFSDFNTKTNDSPAVDRWLQKAFPRYYLASKNGVLNTPCQQMVADISNNYQVTVSNPASALVVFLGGVPGVTGNYSGYSVQNPGGTAIPWRSDGFSADATAPFGPNNPYPNAGTTVQPRIAPKFTFPSARVDTSLGSPYFCPPAVTAAGSNTIPAPYVYFRAGLDQLSGAWCYNYCYNSANSTYVTQQFPLASPSPADYAVPYQKVVPGNNNAVTNPPWRNNDSFQIISSGLDGLYGYNMPASSPYVAGRVAGLPAMLSIGPTAGYPYTGGDLDNVTNFVQNGSTLEDETHQ
jgi:prepilin-type N-terminal cleavage/methylation domain-containing protein